jgi:hypothetical protein
VSGTGKTRRIRSRWSWRGGWLLCVASEAAGGDESGSKLARTPLAGARGEQGGVSSAALAEEPGRGRWRQFEVVEAEMAVGARASTTEEAAAGLMVGLAAAVRRRRRTPCHGAPARRAPSPPLQTTPTRPEGTMVAASEHAKSFLVFDAE